MASPMLVVDMDPYIKDIYSQSTVLEMPPPPALVTGLRRREPNRKSHELLGNPATRLNSLKVSTIFRIPTPPSGFGVP